MFHIWQVHGQAKNCPSSLPPATLNAQAPTHSRLPLRSLASSSRIRSMGKGCGLWFSAHNLWGPSGECSEPHPQREYGCGKQPVPGPKKHQLLVHQSIAVAKMAGRGILSGLYKPHAMTIQHPGLSATFIPPPLLLLREMKGRV
jgi:hypothetical protein